jgi:uncharacterized alkaline shock family protein YloU
MENMSDVAMRITTTVESELMNATAVSSFINYIHVQGVGERSEHLYVFGLYL